MSHVTATRERIAGFAALDHEGPIHMLNLLRYRPEGGRERYREYKKATLPILMKTGARLALAGEPLLGLIGPDDERWDEMIVVEYPSREAFLSMITSPEYRAIAHLRDEALVDSRLVCMRPLPTF